MTVNTFTQTPKPENMVTQKCTRPECMDVLCVECAWEGHCEPQDAPWPIFRTHNCKLRLESVSSFL